jgi:hypothetical protein
MEQGVALQMQVSVQLDRSAANAAAAVLRGYLQHQRERLGERAAENLNFRLVSAALEQALAAASATEAPRDGA